MCMRVFFVNSDKGLRYTTDLGASWTIVDEVPFSATVTALPNVDWSEEMPASATYFTQDGYLYAFTQKQGIFRASLESITGQTPVSVDNDLPREWAAGIGARVFPNPASGSFWVEMDLPQATEICIDAFDLLGRRIGLLSENALFHKGKHLLSFDAAAWPDGLYMIRFRANGKSFVQKLIKQTAGR
jgi:hypothetical protein